MKILKDLQDQDLIAGKASGKSRRYPVHVDSLICIGKAFVYHALQDPKDSLSAEELALMDKEISTLRSEIAAFKNEEKALKAQLNTLNAAISIPELRTCIDALHVEIGELSDRLSALRTGQTKAISAEEKTEVDKSWKLWSYKANTRKKGCMELWGAICENLPEGKTKHELWVYKSRAAL